MSTSGYGLVKITWASRSAPGAERGVPLQQVARNRPALDLDGAVGQHPLDRLVLGDWTAERDPLPRIIQCHLEQPLCLAECPGRDDDPSLADPGHGKLEALSDFAKDVLSGHADPVEADL